jgi:hypothetical protein
MAPDFVRHPPSTTALDTEMLVRWVAAAALGEVRRRRERTRIWVDEVQPRFFLVLHHRARRDVSPLSLTEGTGVPPSMASTAAPFSRRHKKP